jgi:alpha-glucosidase (family GH31 glycosyl hydrolase)
MQDFGEQVQVGMHFDDGSTGATMHNRLPILFHRATREAVRSFERRHPRRRIYWFTRAGYSGTPGSARYEMANFPGDETTDWSRSAGIASLTTDMLNRGIGGAYGFTTDIGGFYDIPYGATGKELFLRWAEWAALSPFFRIHGSVDASTHTPWSYDAATLRAYKGLARLHRRAEPLIMRLWQRARKTGMPVTRPLWLQYPGDRRAARQDQEWLLGPDLLVAPVVEQGSTSRKVYLPRGCWRLRGGERHRGPAAVEVAAPLGALPWFSRCGTRPLG